MSKNLNNVIRENMRSDCVDPDLDQLIIEETRTDQANTYDNHQTEDEFLMDEDPLRCDTLSTTVPMSKQDLDQCIKDAVNKALGNMNELIGKLVNGTLSNNENVNHSRYQIPNFSFPRYEKEDKLNGTQNSNLIYERTDYFHTSNTNWVMKIYHETKSSNSMPLRWDTWELQLHRASQIHYSALIQHSKRLGILRYTMEIKSFNSWFDLKSEPEIYTLQNSFDPLSSYPTSKVLSKSIKI